MENTESLLPALEGAVPDIVVKTEVPPSTVGMVHSGNILEGHQLGISSGDILHDASAVTFLHILASSDSVVKIVSNYIPAQSKLSDVSFIAILFNSQQFVYVVIDFPGGDCSGHSHVIIQHGKGFIIEVRSQHEG